MNRTRPKTVLTVDKLVYYAELDKKNDSSYGNA